MLLLLACGGAVGATGAYVALGPSGSSKPTTFIGVGHGRLEGASTEQEKSRPSAHQHPHRHHQHPQRGANHGRVGQSGHDHGRGAGHGRPPTHHGQPAPGTSQLPTPGRKQFTVTVGRFKGLYPGLTARLPVVYANPHSFSLTITRVVTGTPGSNACGARFFTTSTTSPSGVRVPGRSSVTSSVPFGMRPSAPDSCQGTSVVVDVTATAVKS